MQVSRLAGSSQKDRHSSSPLQPQGPPLIPISAILRPRTASSADINPAFSAKSIHSPICDTSSQYVSHSSCPLHPPGPEVNPAAIIFLACSASSGDIKSFSTAKSIQGPIFIGSSQNVSHSSLPRHPPGPWPPVRLIIAASSADINPAASAKLIHSSKCSG